MNNIDIITNQPDLELIMEKHNIPRERFVRGVIFAEYIVNGENATNSYMWAFECERDEARMNSSNLRNSKWIQDLILYLKPDENTLYFGEIRAIIRKGMKIIDDPMSEDKDVIAAMNALAKYIKASKSSKDEEKQSSTDAQKMMSQLMDGIKQLTDQGKMVDKHGNIIDVPVLE